VWAPRCLGRPLRALRSLPFASRGLPRVLSAGTPCCSRSTEEFSRSASRVAPPGGSLHDVGPKQHQRVGSPSAGFACCVSSGHPGAESRPRPWRAVGAKRSGPRGPQEDAVAANNGYRWTMTRGFAAIAAARRLLRALSRLLWCLKRRKRRPTHFFRRCACSTESQDAFCRADLRDVIRRANLGCSASPTAPPGSRPRGPPRTDQGSRLLGLFDRPTLAPGSRGPTRPWDRQNNLPEPPKRQAGRGCSTAFIHHGRSMAGPRRRRCTPCPTTVAWRHRIAPGPALAGPATRHHTAPEGTRSRPLQRPAVPSAGFRARPAARPLGSRRWRGKNRCAPWCANEPPRPSEPPR